MSHEEKEGKQQRGSRTVFWVWTNYKEKIPYERVLWKYFIQILEACPTTGRKHWQGYGILRLGATHRTMRDYFPGVTIFERKGSHDEARIYCTPGKGRTPPDDTWVKPLQQDEYGEQPRRGFRTDLASDAWTAAHGDLRDITPANYVRYNRGLEKYRALHREIPDRRPVRVYWRWGATGTGKSHAAREAYPKSDTWTSKFAPGWFDYYDGHKHAIFDELGVSDYGHKQLLRLLDVYTMDVPTKGGHTTWCPEMITVTSHEHPRSFVPFENWPELERRITQIIEHTEVYKG